VTAEVWTRPCASVTGTRSDAVHAAFVLHPAEGAFSLDHGDDLFEPAQTAGGAAADDLHFHPQVSA